MKFEKKSCSEEGLDKMYVNKHTYQSWKCNDLKVSEHKVQSKSN